MFRYFEEHIKLYIKPLKLKIEVKDDLSMIFLQIGREYEEKVS